MMRFWIVLSKPKSLSNEKKEIQEEIIIIINNNNNNNIISIISIMFLWPVRLAFDNNNNDNNDNDDHDTSNNKENTRFLRILDIHFNTGFLRAKKVDKFISTSNRNVHTRPIISLIQVKYISCVDLSFNSRYCLRVCLILKDNRRFWLGFYRKQIK